jgi:(p)ppGpp synthase/HD superfamily hydrolase
MKLDVVAVASGLLHDIVEDTQADRRIRSCSAPTSPVVKGAKLGTSVSSSEAQAENRKMLLAMVDDSA